MIGLTFVSGNVAKTRYVRLWLDYPFVARNLDIPEIQSLDLHEVTEDKLLKAYELLHVPVFVEDVSLQFTAFGSLPGPLIKWFLKDLGVDRLCALLDNYSDRTATAKIEFGLHDGSDTHYFSGSVSGMIAKKPKGESGFGWNALFIPDGQRKTYAQMDDITLKRYSHRALALAKLQTYLRQTK